MLFGLIQEHGQIVQRQRSSRFKISIFNNPFVSPPETKTCKFVIGYLLNY